MEATVKEYIIESCKVNEESAKILSTDHDDTEELNVLRDRGIVSLNTESETLESKKKKKKKKKRKGKEEVDKNTNSTSEIYLNLTANLIEIEKEEEETDAQDERIEEKTIVLKTIKKENGMQNNISSKHKNEKNYFEILGEDIVGGIYTRVVIVGDYFLLDYSKLWPSNSTIKPFFLYKNKLSIDELYVKFSGHYYLKNSRKIFLLFVLGLHDFADYATFLKASCTGNHLFTEYIHDGKNLNTMQCQKFIKKLLDIKQNFELMDHLSVSFSYFPELKNIRNLRTIFNSIPEDIPNCTCLCRNLGDLPGKITASHFTNAVFNINRKLSIKQLNSPKDKRIFEYMPPTVSFVNGTWGLTRLREYSQDDVLVLDFLLREYVCGKESLNSSDEENEVERLLAIMRTRIWRCKFRFILIGDSWIDFIARQWPLSSKIVPYFYFAENLTLKDICKVILSLVRREEIGLVITAVPSGEFLNTKCTSVCKDHKTLEYLVPNKFILEDPVSYANELIIKINQFLEETKHLRQNCGVVFTTCYPIQFGSYYSHLRKEHCSNGQKSHTDPSVIDDNFLEYESKLSQCLEVINQYIVSSHKMHELPVCNIYNVVNLATENFAFPSFIERKSPPKSIRKELFSCVKNYVKQFYDLCNARKLTFTQTEDYKRKEVSKKIRAWKKRKYKNEIIDRRETNYKVNRNIIKNTRLVASDGLSSRMQRLNISYDSHKYRSCFNSDLAESPPRGYPFNSGENNLLPLASGLKSTSPSGYFSGLPGVVSSSSIINRNQNEGNRHLQSYSSNPIECSSLNDTMDFGSPSYEPRGITTGSQRRVRYN